MAKTKVVSETAEQRRLEAKGEFVYFQRAAITINTSKMSEDN